MEWGGLDWFMLTSRGMGRWRLYETSEWVKEVDASMGGWAAYLSSVGAEGAVTPTAIAAPEWGSGIRTLCDRQDAGPPFAASVEILALLLKFMASKWDSKAAFRMDSREEMMVDLRRNRPTLNTFRCSY